MRAWALPTNRTLYGSRCARTVGLTVRGVGFYFRNVTELVFSECAEVCARLSPGGRRSICSPLANANTLASRMRFSTSRSLFSGPYLELFARFRRPGWAQWGNEDVEQNSVSNVAYRKGHSDPQLRLLESPRGYRGISMKADGPRSELTKLTWTALGSAGMHHLESLGFWRFRSDGVIWNGAKCRQGFRVTP